MTCSFENQNNGGPIVNEVLENSESSLAALINPSNSSLEKYLKQSDREREFSEIVNSGETEQKGELKQFPKFQVTIKYLLPNHVFSACAYIIISLIGLRLQTRDF